MSKWVIVAAAKNVLRKNRGNIYRLNVSAEQFICFISRVCVSGVGGTRRQMRNYMDFHLFSRRIVRIYYSTNAVGLGISANSIYSIKRWMLSFAFFCLQFPVFWSCFRRRRNRVVGASLERCHSRIRGTNFFSRVAIPFIMFTLYSVRLLIECLVQNVWYNSGWMNVVTIAHTHKKRENFIARNKRNIVAM